METIHFNETILVSQQFDRFRRAISPQGRGYSCRSSSR